MKSVQEVHASAGRLIQDARQCQATLDRLPIEAQRITDHRLSLNAALAKLKQARQLAVEAPADTSQAAEDLVDQASSALRAEQLFVAQQRLADSGAYRSIG